MDRDTWNHIQISEYVWNNMMTEQERKDLVAKTIRNLTTNERIILKTIQVLQNDENK